MGGGAVGRLPFEGVTGNGGAACDAGGAPLTFGRAPLPLALATDFAFGATLVGAAPPLVVLAAAWPSEATASLAPLMFNVGFNRCLA